MRNVFLEKCHKFNNNSNIDSDKFISLCESMNDYLYKHNDILWQPEIESLYKDYRRKQNKLYEGLIKTYPVESTLNKLRNLGFEADKLIQDNNNTTIIVRYHPYDHSKIKKIMDVYGWYEQCLYNISNKKWIYFLPKFGLEATSNVYSGEMKIYHITNDYYIDKILKNGLQPRSHSKIEKDQPNRIYFFEKDPYRYTDFIKHLYSRMRNHKNSEIENIYVLEIDLSKCEDKLFYYDNLASNAVYTHENIPPQCISIKHKINVNDL